MRQSRRPKLAQHFLRDTRYRARIVEALALGPDDLVVEIGAGRGAVTELLAVRARRLIAIELDPVLAEKLVEKFRGNPRIDVLQGDILSTNLAELCRHSKMEKCFVFGNLPYYITSPILHHLFIFWRWIRAMALLMQREVADRITAAPGTRAYGYLSVLTQLKSQPRIVLGVPAGAFSPSPKVQSALVGFQMGAKFPDWTFEEEKNFLDFVKRCFGQKRKNLVNNLGEVHPRSHVEQTLRELDLPTTVRAEQLNLDQFVNLFKQLASGRA